MFCIGSGKIRDRNITDGCVGTFLSDDENGSHWLKMLRRHYPKMIVVSRGSRRWTDVFLNYELYLQNDYGWRDFRDTIIKTRDSQCEKCHSEIDLEVHHKTYNNVGNEKPEDVIVLCEPCHCLLHRERRLSA